jgi:hypothetical protein
MFPRFLKVAPTGKKIYVKSNLCKSNLRKSNLRKSIIT